MGWRNTLWLSIVILGPGVFLWMRIVFRYFFPAPMDQALGQFDGDMLELPTVDEMLGDFRARERALQHIGSIGFNTDACEIFVTRLDGGVQTLERRASAPNDNLLERAKLLATELGVEFREI